jgi:hypothetical protein
MYTLKSDGGSMCYQTEILTTFGSDFYGKVTEMLQACRTQAWDQLIGVRKAYTPPET